MTRLASLFLCLSLAAPAAVAEPVVRGDVKLRIDLPEIVVRDRDRTPPRGYIRFDDYDERYDRVERWRGRYDISGTYDSRYGRVVLTQDGNRVRGTYEAGGGGVIKGRIRNGALHFRWRGADGEGRGVWYVRDGRTRVIEGTWGTWGSASNAGQWDLRRVGMSRHDRNRHRDRGYRRY